MKNIIAISVVTAAMTLGGMRMANAGHNCSTTRAGRCKVDAVKVPTSPAAFKKLRAKLAKDPFAAATLMGLALISYSKNPKLGEQLMLLASHKRLLRKGGKAVYKGWGWGSSMSFMMRMAKKYHYCFAGFASNSVEKAGKFWVDHNAVEFELKIQTRHVSNPSTGRYKLWMCATNKMCFPMGMRQAYMKQGGQLVKVWKISGNSSAFTGCRRPKAVPTADPDL